MVFSSMTFLWVFFPITFVLGMLIRTPRYQNIILLIASLIFYAWGGVSYLWLLLASIMLNWVFGLLIDRFENQRRLFLILDVVANLGLLGYFKYTNFFMDTLRKVIPSVPETNVVLPIGISFFTFQAMSYVIDLYRGRYKVQKNPFNLMLYISFFPQLIAGPIVQYKDIDDQLMDRSITPEKVASGLRRFIYGLGKKVIISNLLAKTVDTIYAMEIGEITTGMAWCAAIFYTLQIYYDFSGYSDMAIGLGRMFGFEFLENFNYPYISKSIKEFWRRWHISLSSWFRDYVYIPLGGNRKGQTRTYVNLFVVFFLTGLWHGAAWNFVGWGLYHGFFIIIERLGFGRFLERHPIFARIYTILVFVVGWVFFAVTSVRFGFKIVFRMFMPWTSPAVAAGLGTMLNTQTILAAIAGIIGCGILQSVMGSKRLAPVADKWRNSLPEAIYLGVVLFVTILMLAGNSYNPFIYFRF